MKSQAILDKCPICQLKNKKVRYKSRRFIITASPFDERIIIAFTQHRIHFPPRDVDNAIAKAKELYGHQVKFNWRRLEWSDHAHFHIKNEKQC